MILAPAVAVRSIRNAAVVNSKIEFGTSDNRVISDVLKTLSETPLKNFIYFLIP